MPIVLTVFLISALLRALRCDFKMVFQNSAGALNPRWTIGDSILEPLVNRRELSRAEQYRRVRAYLEQVHLPESTLNKRPHELSGGEQTRVCIARALITKPELLILDESVSGLDATIKKQILDLLRSIRAELSCTYLFITHDIEAAMYLSDNISVMKEGRIIESVWGIQSLDELQHPYSRLLAASLPDVGRMLNQMR